MEQGVVVDEEMKYVDTTVAIPNSWASKQIKQTGRLTQSTSYSKSFKQTAPYGSGFGVMDQRKLMAGSLR